MEELLNKLRNRDIDVNVINNKLVMNVPEGFGETEIIEEVKEKKKELIKYINERKKVKNDINTISKAALKEHYKLTPPQKRMFFLHELSKKSLAYNLSQAYTVQGAIDKKALTKSFEDLVNRHESLRSYFELVDHQPVQKVLPKVTFEIEYYEGHKRNLQKGINKFIRPFDLRKAPLIRVALVELDVENHVLLIDMHHIISDGTSFQVLIQDFASLYNKQVLHPLNLNYSDYAEWYHGEQNQNMVYEQKKFWLEEFREPLTTIDLPTDFQRPTERKFNGDTVKFSLSKEKTAELQNIADKANTSIFMVLLSVYTIWLSKLSGQEQVVIGTPVAGRKDSDIEKIIGMFVNTLALRLYPQNILTFTEYLSKVNLKTLACFDNQDYPYEELIDDLHLSRDLSHNPLFDVLFVFQNISKEAASLKGLTINSFDTEQKTAKFDLSLAAFADDSCLNFEFEYSTELFKKATIERFISYFNNVLLAIIDNENIHLKDVSLIKKPDQSYLLALNNKTEIKYPKNLTIVKIFEKRVLETPDHIAIEENGNQLTYQELNNKANRLAHYLKAQGVERGVIVGLLMDKSTDLIIAMLAILKAGGAYLPIDADYPESRIQYILEDSKIAYLITDKRTSRKGINCKNILIDQLKLDKFNTENPDQINKPSDVCYVIYTSGTTGHPKGVLIEHRNVVRLFFNKAFQFDFNKNDVWTMFHSHCFDFSVWEMYGALLYSGKLVMVSKFEAMDPLRFLKILKEQKVTVLNQTPTAFYNLIQEDLKKDDKSLSLRFVIFGGEMLAPSKLKQWHSNYPEVKLINMFGTTETTVHATYKEIGNYEIENNISNIGNPIPTLSVYVLDKHMNVVPEGVIGELYIGGAGVGRGYLRRKKLTSERFIHNPYRKKEKLYRTGDLARILSGGEIEYLGREDFQVKIRGFRIELGEIEYHLLQHAHVDNAIVIVKTKEGQKSLCAYLVGKEGLSMEEIRDYLHEKLPSYMVPSYFMQIDFVPLTSNSKVDVSMLPDPQAFNQAGYVAPESENEKKIAAVWSDVLSIKEAGIKDNYFSLGGDSLKAIGLIYGINNTLKSKLTIADLYSNQTIEKLAKLAASKNDDLSDNFIQAENEVVAFKNAYIANQGNDDSYEEIYPMNGIEKGMVFHSLKRGEADQNLHNIIYHEQTVYPVFYAKFSFDLFKQALNLMVEKHDSLRKIYDLDNFAHLIKKKIEPEIHYMDISGLPRNEQEVLLRQKMQEEQIKATNLSFSIIWRMTIVKLNDDYHYLLFDMHHSLFDGWSLSSFITELNNTYFHLKKDSGFKPKKLECDYRDQIIGEIAATKNASSISYWQNELLGYNRIQLPQTGQEHKYVKKIFDFGSKFRSDLEHLADKHDTTFKHLCFAAYVYFMKMISYSNDLVVGIATNNRPLVPDGEQLLGCFLNTIPVRTQIPEQSSWKEFIDYIEGKMRELKKHEHVPLFEILRMIDDRTLYENPVYDTFFNFIDFRVFKDLITDDSENNENADFELGSFININTLFDLHINAHNDEFKVAVSYSTSTMDEKLLDQIIHYFENILIQFLTNINGTIRNTSILSQAESKRLLYELNETDVDTNAKRCILDLFEKQATLTPDHIAVEEEERKITYAQLNARANQLANFLRSKGVKKQDVVGMMLYRSEEMMISIYALLKLGAIYLPLDLNNPVKRNEYVLENSDAKFLIVPTEAYKKTEFKCEQISLENAPLQTFPDKNIHTKIAESDIVYIIYTSGSTGQPKGVPIRNYALFNRLIWMQKSYPLDHHDKILHKTKITFDVSIWEIYWWGITGASVFLLPNNSERDSEKICEVIESKGISVMHFVPSVLSVFLEVFGNYNIKRMPLKNVFSSGEALTISQVMEFHKLLYIPYQVKLINLYGPTEATIDVTYYNCFDDFKTDRVPIGKPIDNTQLYIVDKANQLLPEGIVGELCIAGDGIFDGYVNNQKQSDKVLVEHPVNAAKKMYKTGDLAFWMDDNIQYVGRLDNQIKIRGFRIELGEIEHALLKHEEIKEAVVLAKENNNNEKELVAYITSKSTQNTAELRSYLKELLPEYMLPAHYVQLEELPLTANGKIDKRSLPDPEGLGLSSGVEYIAPRNEIEEKLVKIWEDVLQRNNIGVKDDFFALGGHSLKAIRLSNQYQRELLVKLSLKELFEHTTIASHAELIQSSKKSEFIEIVKLAKEESYPISDAQRRLWVLSQFEGGSAAYNIPASTSLNQEINIAYFKKAIDAVIERHEILRTVFKEDEKGDIRQWVLTRENLGFQVDYKDFRKEQNKEEKARSYIKEDAFKTFDLERGPLLRAGLLQLEDEHYVFYFNTHHIISDGWSMEVLRKDIITCYEAYKAGKQPALKELRIQYKDYSVWQLAQLEEESFKSHRSYWLESLKGELPLIDLPTTQQRPRLKTNNGHGLSTYISRYTSSKLKEYAQANGGSLFMGLLAAWNVLMYRYSGQTDIIIGTPIAGREHADLEDQIGFYVNTLALRNELHPEEDFHTYYRTVRDNTLKSYHHQMYPFDRLVEDLNLARDTSRSAVFDVMLVLENNGEKQEVQMAQGIDHVQEDQLIDQGVKNIKFDLLISVEEQGDYLRVSVEYNTDVYERKMIEGLIVHYKSLLLKLISDPNQALGKIDYLSEKERKKLLSSFNDTLVNYSDRTVMELFEEQAAKTPDKIALLFEEDSLTYGELNKRSNILAHFLQDHYEVSRTTKVGVMLERSIESVIAMIGVMKTGACYVPIDHHYPKERVSYILADSTPRVIVSTKALSKKHEININEVVDMHKLDLKDGNKNNAVKTNNPEDASYVIYTSGSTGKPKGVVQTHRMMSNLIHWDIHHSGITAGLKYLQYSSFSFDASLHDLYFTLSAGGSAYIVNESSRLDYLSLKEQIISKGIEVLSMPFSALNAFCTETGIDTIAHHRIKFIVSTAEQLYVNDALEKFLKKNPKVELHNHYGPSESHVVTSYKMSVEMGNIESRASIGEPISNSRIYILDAYHNLVPQGVTGELYIGGDNLAIGYLNKEELTNEKFIDNAYEKGKLYKTGDQGYWRSDGNIEFIGRKDDQVKIRGYRIELGEIEQALLKNEQITEAVVLARENQNKEKELVAYITGTAAQTTNELRAYLKELLPDYMLPSYYVQLEELPLNSNGKIDKKALPDPGSLGLSSGVAYVAPRNELEEKLVKIWEKVLRQDNIGINDDFFVLGGHSIKAIKLLMEYNKSFDVRLSMEDIFIKTQLYAHAELIDIRNWAKEDPAQETISEDIETFNL